MHKKNKGKGKTENDEKQNIFQKPEKHTFLIENRKREIKS